MFSVYLIFLHVIILLFDEAMKAQRGSRYACTLSLTSALDGVGGYRFTRGKETWTQEAW
jgi:hypothetical protein